jgi:hypothetical protein
MTGLNLGLLFGMGFYRWLAAARLVETPGLPMPRALEVALGTSVAIVDITRSG